MSIQWLGNRAGFGVISKLLHWLIAALMLFSIGLGWYLVGLSYYDPYSQDALIVHQSAGLLILFLAVLSLTWRYSSPQPAPLTIPSQGWQRLIVQAVHGLLSLLTLLIPVCGYLISTSAGEAVSILGWFDVPALFSITDGVRDSAIRGHFYLAYGCLALVLLHLLGALKHHFIDGDDTLRRML